jgi:hypothetical protein
MGRGAVATTRRSELGEDPQGRPRRRRSRGRVAEAELTSAVRAPALHVVAVEERARVRAAARGGATEAELAARVAAPTLDAPVDEELLLETHVHFRPGNRRPRIELQSTAHPLAVEQRTGITLARAWQIVHAYMPN